MLPFKFDRSWPPVTTVQKGILTFQCRPLSCHALQAPQCPPESQSQAMIVIQIMVFEIKFDDSQMNEKTFLHVNEKTFSHV